MRLRSWDVQQYGAPPSISRMSHICGPPTKRQIFPTSTSWLDQRSHLFFVLVTQRKMLRSWTPRNDGGKIIYNILQVISFWGPLLQPAKKMWVYWGVNPFHHHFPSSSVGSSRRGTCETNRTSNASVGFWKSSLSHGETMKPSWLLVGKTQSHIAKHSNTYS